MTPGYVVKVKTISGSESNPRTSAAIKKKTLSLGHYKGLRANAESAIFSIRIDTTTRQKYQTQFPREEKNRYKNRMKLRMARDEKKMSNDGCTTALTIWARWRWAFHCDITFIIPQRTVFTDKKKHDRITLYSYSICICTQSASKSNWFSFFVVAVSLSARDP